MSGPKEFNQRKRRLIKKKSFIQIHLKIRAGSEIYPRGWVAVNGCVCWGDPGERQLSGQMDKDRMKDKDG